MLNIVKSLFCLLLFVALSANTSAQNKELLYPTAMCWTGERIFMVDTGDMAIKEVDKDGKVLGAYGGKGKGPGEFESIGKMHCGKEGLYVTDSASKRITYLPYSNLKAVKTYPFDNDLFANTLKECGTYICIGGNDFKNKKTLHIYTREFEYVKSIGEDLKFVNANPYIESARHQLAQTEFEVLDDETIVVVRPAPLEITTIKDPFGAAGFTKTERHDLIPKPWETEHMRLTADSYSVGAYTQAHSFSMDASKRGMFVIFDIVQKSTLYEYDYKTNNLRNTGFKIPPGSMLSNLVHIDGRSVYLLYHRDSGAMTQRWL
jgi:hypothetical protein